MSLTRTLVAAPGAALGTLGAAVIRALGAAGRLTLFALAALSHIVRPPLYPREFGMALLHVGWLSLPVVGMTAISVNDMLIKQLSARWRCRSTPAARGSMPRRWCRRSSPSAWCASWGRCWSG